MTNPFRNPAVDDLLSHFASNNLGEPPLPPELATAVRKDSDWTWSSRVVEKSAYRFQDYVEEALYQNPRDYVLIGHAGHGSNSYAISFFLVRGALRLFLQVAWGGAYMDPVESAANVRASLAAAARLIKAVEILERSPRWSRETTLFVACSEFYGSWWAPLRLPLNEPTGPHAGAGFEPPDRAGENLGFAGMVSVMACIKAANQWAVEQAR